MQKKINISLLLYALGTFFLIINFLIFYQKRVNRILTSNFETEFKKVILENSVLTDIIFENLEKKQLDPVFINSELTNNKSDHRQNILGWRFFENNCEKCLEEEFLNIKKYSELIGIEKVVIFTSSHNMRELKASFSARNMREYKLINIPESEINLSSGGPENKPFYFILDSTGFANLIFKPDVRAPYLTEKYFKMAINKFFSSK